MLSCPEATDAVASCAVRALFHVTATAEPNLLPRLIAPLARLGHVPSRMHASRESGDGTELSVDLRITGLRRDEAERVAGNLRSVVGVRSVIAVFEAEG